MVLEEATWVNSIPFLLTRRSPTSSIDSYVQVHCSEYFPLSRPSTVVASNQRRQSFGPTLAQPPEREKNGKLPKIDIVVVVSVQGIGKTLVEFCFLIHCTFLPFAFHEKRYISITLPLYQSSTGVVVSVFSRSVVVVAVSVSSV